MTRVLAILTWSLFLGLAIVSVGHAAEVSGCSQPSAPAAGADAVEPIDVLAFDATQDATTTSESGSCNDTRNEVFSDTNPQVCRDYCSSNGWTFVASYDRRWGQICVCCAD